MIRGICQTPPAESHRDEQRQLTQVSEPTTATLTTSHPHPPSPHVDSQKADADATQRLAALKNTPINALLSEAKAKEQRTARKILELIFSCVRFLGRQGLPLRGDANRDGVLWQLMQERVRDDPDLDKWLKRRDNWMLNNIQNEILELFAHDILRTIGATASKTDFVGLTADGTTDTSGKEQFSISLQFSNDHLEDVLVRLHLPLERLKGYCFDGASNMSGRFNGVQAKLKEVCPDSVFVHCTNHSLDLVLQEVAREGRLVADTLNFVREVTVIINDSAKRKALYQSLFGAGDVVNLLGLCPTRWCVRVVSLSRLLACYGEMIQTFRTLESDKAVKGDTCGKIAGLLTKATNMRTVFGLFACVTLFTPCEAVARSLQGTKDETITDLVAKTKQYAERYSLKPPHPVRSSRTPARFRYTQVEEANDQECRVNVLYPNVWKREMFEALDLVRSEVERRFDQVGIQVAAGREQAIIEAAQGKKVYVTYLKLTGFTRERLSHELDILRDICTGPEVSILQTTQPQTRSMLSEVEKLIKLCMCLPISVAASERSFSALRRLKTWLRNTMSQERLTHLAIMNAHSDLLDEIDVSTLIKSRTTERRSTFGNA
ncbi:unnamed protein product [Leuciscus chuanchicus]